MVISKKMCAQMLIALGLLVLAGITAAEDKATGKELIQKAREVSDIRADGAPAFRMEGTFRIIPKKGGKEIEGTYAEIWISRTKWRREAQTSSSQNVEIGAGSKSWVVPAGADRLSKALSPRLTLRPQPFSRDAAEISRVSERQIDSIKMTCFESKTRWEKVVDCVDPANSVLLVHETVSRSTPAPFHQSCMYRKYEKFGQRLFPRSIRCTSDPDDDVELTILKLVAEPLPDEALFARPPGAVEVGNCQTRPNPPQAVYTRDPAYPGHHSENFNVTVVLWTIVGEDGKPRDSRVARSVGKDFDQAALDALENWTFKPATCQGSPIALPINVEITFRKF
jgi:TonB family protein